MPPTVAANSHSRGAPLPGCTIPMAQWGEDHRTVLQRDRPVVTTEAAQPGQSLRPLLRLAISVVSTSQLADRVHQHRAEHSHPVLGRRRSTRAGSRSRGEPQRQRRLGSAPPSAHHDQRRTERSPPRAVEPPARPPPGLLGRVVSRTQPSAPGGDHHRMAHATASRSAAPTASPSGTTTGPGTSNPRSSRAAAMIGPDLSG